MQRGHRLVLVVTGKGNPRNDESASWMMSPHGVLKQMVPRWLNEPELAALIASSAARPCQAMAAMARSMSICGRAEMKQAFHTLTVPTQGPGLYEFTDEAARFRAGREDRQTGC